MVTAEGAVLAPPPSPPSPPTQALENTLKSSPQVLLAVSAALTSCDLRFFFCPISVPASEIFIESEFERVLSWVWTSEVDQSRIGENQAVQSCLAEFCCVSPPVLLICGEVVHRALGGGGPGLLTPPGPRRRIQG